MELLCIIILVGAGVLVNLMWQGGKVILRGFGKVFDAIGRAFDRMFR